MRIENSVAVISGGASGLGKATAQALHDHGAKIVIIDLPSSDGAATAQALGDNAHFVAADVTSDGEVAEAVKFASTLGDLRIAVNCAGIGTPGKVLGRTGALPLADFERVVRVNLLGTFNVIRLAAEQIAHTDPIDGERGVIINTASVAAFDGQIGQPAYAASKGGVAAMTLPIARELARHLIRVATIAPGIFETPMLAGLPQEAQQSLGQQVPHPSRLGRVSEYAALATHIVENPMLNGETIRLDGAIRMAPR
ncbi:NAD(P)-dependent dehydrogenase (short-subunit alcohol dehydrogenase family) [Rhodococcus rhodochrous J45]|uniref:NAD(P)-dependent dehydrogenase (Short-subunit alcohol dehydrogenase family) n=1 Tax=Rhodococcus rhodochrous J45 TaxID=935266 RepID=A0A562DH69_RHORH|nr:3-hydroxyacyl-CoA dehydrogenase [Rhodococcus rhodochrous]TWH08976.1 NAD(P)-dependent dehydrogenase (short-subunit alcohol dehydrogenase family) [Rhodococcus rhodochrous J45]